MRLGACPGNSDRPCVSYGLGGLWTKSVSDSAPAVRLARSARLAPVGGGQSAAISVGIRPLGSTAPANLPGFRQFQKVVGQADQVPLVGDLRQPTQVELPKAARTLDLPENRLHRLLA